MSTAAPSATRLVVPTRLSRETRGMLPSPDTTLAQVNTAIETYRDARTQEKNGRKLAEEAAAIILPVAREVFARMWVERGARPKPPILLVSNSGIEVGFVVEERRGSSIDEATAERLEDAVGADLFADLVSRGKTYRFNDALLVDVTIRKKLRAAIESSNLFSKEEQAALIEEKPTYACRTSVEGTLASLGRGTWVRFVQVLSALSAVVRQYPTLAAVPKPEA